jgi:sister-chromatid-cohesion protein PDS5
MNGVNGIDARLTCSVKALHNELSGTEQGEVDLDSIREIAATLVSNRLVSHKDAGVKAYTSCCLSDILRLFAPDAPYTITELTVSY